MENKGQRHHYCIVLMYMDPRVQHFVNTLKQRGLTLALAESMTCGMAAYRLSGSSGTSEVLLGSIVCYTPEVKSDVLKVPQKVMDKYTCESKEVTALLARNLKRVVNADICAAITGLASPGGSETKYKPVGTVFFSVLYKNKLHHHRQLFKGAPLEIKKKACLSLYRFILSVI